MIFFLWLYPKGAAKVEQKTDIEKVESHKKFSLSTLLIIN